MIPPDHDGLPDHREPPVYSLRQLVGLAALWLLFLAVTVFGSFFGAAFLVRAFIFRSQVSAWGFETMFCILAPFGGFAIYCYCFAFFRQWTFPRRCACNSLIAILFSAGAMLLLYSFSAR